MGGGSQTSGNGSGTIRGKRNANATPSVMTMTTLKLATGAFNEELSAIIGTNKVGYTGDDHDQLVERLLARLETQDGKPYGLDDEAKNVLKLIFRPTTTLQLDVLRQVFAADQSELDAATEGAFSLLFNVAQFGEYLKKKVNPKTKKPFIAKPPSRAKRKTLDDLLAEEKVTDATPAPSVETPAAENDAEGDLTPAATIPPPPSDLKDSGTNK